VARLTIADRVHQESMTRIEQEWRGFEEHRRRLHDALRSMYSYPPYTMGTYPPYTMGADIMPGRSVEMKLNPLASTRLCPHHCGSTLVVDYHGSVWCTSASCPDPYQVTRWLNDGKFVNSAYGVIYHEGRPFWREADGSIALIQIQKELVPDKKEMAVCEAAQPANRVTASVLPDGVNVLSVPRIGDKAKGDAQERLDQAYAEGFLTQKEFKARQEAAQAAKTQTELDMLAGDLQKVIALAPVQGRKKNRAVMHPAVCLLLPAAVFFGTSEALSFESHLLAWLFLAAGIILLFSGIILASRRR
jgi:hypothetical protein